MYVISCSIPVFNEKVYFLHIAGYNNKSDNMITVMQRTFHCSLHVSVVV